MKNIYVSSLGLPKGFKIREYESIDEILKDGGKELVDYPEKGQKMERLAVVANQLLHQKDGLVQGRTELACWVEYVAKFPWLTKQVTKKQDGKDVAVTEYLETEGKYIDRFITAVAEGKATFPGLKLAGTNVEQNEAAVLGAIQSLIDNPVPAVGADGKAITESVNGKDVPVMWFDLRNDIKQPVRVAAAKKPWVTAIKGAEAILANKSGDKWAKTFTKEGIPFEPFNTDNAEANKLNLAWAIQARETKRAQSEYA